MRVEINLPDDSEFIKKLQALADAENRSRKNYMETIIINHVNSAEVKYKTP
jgi:predicted transcriptional regulator